MTGGGRALHHACVVSDRRPRSQTRTRSKPSPAAVRGRAREFVVRALARVKLRAEAAPAGLPADLLVEGSCGRAVLVRLLARAAPHHRGGRGSLGLHWMLSDTPAEYVALVDLSRERGWLLPAADYRARAQPVSGDRYHLDWIVVPIGRPRTKVAAEEEFEEYTFERALPLLAGR